MTQALPHQFGKYELIQRIATGGMAEIFKAKVKGEGGFEKLVAIKRILPHLSDDPEFVAMFMREARLAALLSHPNIVQIYDFGKEDDTYYIAMEYLWGNDLGTILKRVDRKRSLPIECALYIASRVCAGLEYSHHLKDLSGNPLNIIHRDINPQNVIITHQGEVKIVDYGIAKITEMDSTTKVGTLKGKVPYMSPEQASGQVIDRRSDIFSTGVILYEMVTGTKVFQGETLEVLDRVRNADIQPPELVAPGLPAEICEILYTALAKDPEQRFQSCAEMFVRLDNCLTMFSERQNAENLSRHIRHILSSDPLEARPRSQDVVKSAGMLTGLTEICGTDKTHTLMVEPVPAVDGDEAQPRPRATNIRRWLGIAGAVLVVVVVGALFFHARFAGTPDTDRLNEALKAVQNQEFGKALPLFEGLLADRPELAPQVAAGYGAALVHAGCELVGADPEGARKLLEKGIQVDPDNARGYYELAKVCTKLKNYPEAIRHYQRFIELDPSVPEAYFNLGFLYASIENYTQGEEMFSRAIALAPPYLDEAYYNLAMVQKSQGKVDDCIKSLEQAVKINPNNAKAVEHLDELRRE